MNLILFSLYLNVKIGFSHQKMILQLADDIFTIELIKEGYFDKVRQALAFFLPDKLVGEVRAFKEDMSM